MARIVLEQVGKRYGAVAAVADFSLEIADGELVALLGPSGCGKTTTLRMVAGFIEVSHGRISFGDRDVTYLPPYRRNTGMVFQGYALFPHLTVFENVAFGLRRRKCGAAEIHSRVVEALGRVQLDPYADRLPKQLSGGQQQRVALARALVIKPDALLLDEPLSNLDAKLRHDVRVEIRQLQRSLGLTTIFVTHDQEEALSIADRLVVMNKGRIEQIGTPTALYEAPATRFVADFMGKSNFFEGRVVDGVFVTSEGARLHFAADGGPAERTLLTVRPEKIVPLPKPDAAYPNRLEAVVDLVTYLGPTTEIVARTQAGTRVTIHRQNALRESGAGFGPGAPVVLHWLADASRLL